MTGAVSFAGDTYFKANNTEAWDRFGEAVAVWGDTIAVAAPQEDSSSTGVGGDPANNSALTSGAVHVYVRQGASWVQQAYLKASNTEELDRFGSSIALDGDTLAVSAPAEDSSATGVNGPQNNENASQSGAVYVFVRDGGVWTQEAYLKASNTGFGDRFGSSLAISGDTLIVGASYEDSDGQGVGSDQFNNAAMDSGAAYVFRRAGGTWTQEAYLKASNSNPNDRFGYTVDIAGDLIVVGAIGESSPATGVNGAQFDNTSPSSGAAYVFRRTAGAWSQEAYLKASNTDPLDRFGGAVACTAGWVVVGAHQEASSSSGDQSDNSAGLAGAAYVFQYDAGSWKTPVYLKAPNSQSGDEFGVAVAMSPGLLVVTSHVEGSNATGLNGDPLDNSVPFAGAAYAFVLEGSSWSLLHYVKASNTGGGDIFGWSVDIWGSQALLGAPLEDSPALGVGGPQVDDAASTNSGAAYLVPLEQGLEGSASCFGDGSGTFCPCFAVSGPDQGCPNSTGAGAQLRGQGFPSVVDDGFSLAVSGSAPSTLGLVFQGEVSIAGGMGSLLGDGLLCVSPTQRFDVQAASGSGTTQYGPALFSTGLGVESGATFLYQWWYRDVANPCGGGFNFSNAWSVTWF